MSFDVSKSTELAFYPKNREFREKKTLTDASPLLRRIDFVTFLPIFCFCQSIVPFAVLNIFFLTEFLYPRMSFEH